MAATIVCLQRALKVTAADRRAGLATYAVTTDQGLTSYGGVKSVELGERQIEIELDKHSTEELGFARITIGFDPERRAALAPGGEARLPTQRSTASFQDLKRRRPVNT
jgi:hypothetical protein